VVALGREEQLRVQATARAEIVARLVTQVRERARRREAHEARLREVGPGKALVTPERDDAQAQRAPSGQIDGRAEGPVRLLHVIVLARHGAIVRGIERRAIVVEIGKVTLRRETVNAQIEAESSSAPARVCVAEIRAVRSHAGACAHRRRSWRARRDRQDSAQRRLAER
jgi:hypothetical protein